MKKIILILICLFAQLSVIQAQEIRIKTNDDKIFEVSDANQLTSHTITRLILDIGTDSIISLPISSETFQIILDCSPHIYEAYKKITLFAHFLPLVELDDHEILTKHSTQINNLFDQLNRMLDNKTITQKVEIANAANYLDIRLLLIFFISYFQQEVLDKNFNYYFSIEQVKAFSQNESYKAELFSQLNPVLQKIILKKYVPSILKGLITQQNYDLNKNPGNLKNLTLFPGGLYFQCRQKMPYHNSLEFYKFNKNKVEFYKRVDLPEKTMKVLINQNQTYFTSVHFASRFPTEGLYRVSRLGYYWNFSKFDINNPVIKQPIDQNPISLTDRCLILNNGILYQDFDNQTLKFKNNKTNIITNPYKEPLEKIVDYSFLPQSKKIFISNQSTIICFSTDLKQRFWQMNLSEKVDNPDSIMCDDKEQFLIIGSSRVITIYPLQKNSETAPTSFWAIPQSGTFKLLGQTLFINNKKELIAYDLQSKKMILKLNTNLIIKPIITNFENRTKQYKWNIQSFDFIRLFNTQYFLGLLGQFEDNVGTSQLVMLDLTLFHSKNYNVLSAYFENNMTYERVMFLYILRFARSIDMSLKKNDTICSIFEKFPEDVKNVLLQSKKVINYTPLKEEDDVRHEAAPLDQVNKLLIQLKLKLTELLKTITQLKENK